MHRHVDAIVSDAYCWYFSYHTLINLKYNHRAVKTTTAKRLAAEKNCYNYLLVIAPGTMGMILATSLGQVS